VFYLSYKTDSSHLFDQNGLLERCDFKPKYLSNGFHITLQTAYYQRSGTALFYNNTAHGVSSMVKLTARNRVSTIPYHPGNWGDVDGTQAWDGNCQAGSSNPNADEPSDCGQAGVDYPLGYPILDQLGRGQASGTDPTEMQPQELKPLYFWNNTYYYRNINFYR